MTDTRESNRQLDPATGHPLRCSQIGTYAESPATYCSIATRALRPMPRNSAPSLRQVYEQWVEDQIEEYKDSVPRADLLRLADDVCEELRVNQRGQYQLTEMLLCNAVDRKIFKLLKLPAYRTWTRARRSASNPFFPVDGVTRPEQESVQEEVKPIVFAR